MVRADFKPNKGGKGNSLLSPGTLARLLGAADRPEVVMDEAQFVREERGGRVHYRLRQGGEDTPGKGGPLPPFLLSRGPNGARIYLGNLEWSVTTITYERSNGLNHLLGQDAIPGVTRTLPDLWEESGSAAAQDWRDIDWWGDVYLEWTVDPETCEVLEARISGPEVPALSPIPELATDLSREDPASGNPPGYYLKIGTVPEEGDIEQVRTGNVHWAVTFIPAAEDSSGSGSDVVGSSVGSEKSSNAIVPAPWKPEGFCALATVESDRVLFEFLLEFPITGRTTRHKIDLRLQHLCEPGSLTVAAAPNGDRPFPVSASVHDGVLVLQAWPVLRPRKVTLKLTGIRRGFGGWYMPGRTREQFEANERSLAAMYPR